MSYRQSVHWIKPLVVLALGAVILCVTQKTAVGADTVRVAYSSPTATQGILWVADVGGLFKKNGFDVQVIYTRLDIESLVAGEIDWGICRIKAVFVIVERVPGRGVTVGRVWMVVGGSGLTFFDDEVGEFFRARPPARA